MLNIPETHEFPLFPGTGAEDETGVGNIFNATLKAGVSSREFIAIFDQKVLKAIDKFVGVCNFCRLNNFFLIN